VSAQKNGVLPIKVSPQDSTAKVSYSVLTAATAANSEPAPNLAQAHC